MPAARIRLEHVYVGTAITQVCGGSGAGTFHVIQLHVGHQQYAFARRAAQECVVVAVNAAAEPVPLELSIPLDGATQLVDLLNQGETYPARDNRAKIDAVHPNWGRVMVVE